MGGYGLGYGLGGYGMGGYGVGGYGLPGYGWGGAGLYGLGPWAYGPTLYNMGYSTYSNPFDFNSSIASARFVESGASTRWRQGDVLRLFAADQYFGNAPRSNRRPRRPRGSSTRAAPCSRPATTCEALKLCDKALQKLPNDPALARIPGASCCSR